MQAYEHFIKIILLIIVTLLVLASCDLAAENSENAIPTTINTNNTETFWSKT